MTDNLYAAPQARLDQPNSVDTGFLAEPMARGAGAAMSWVSKGWALFMRVPTPWVLLGGAALLALLVLIVVAMIPILGSLVQMVVQLGMVIAGPILLAGFYMAADRVNRGESLEFGQLFDGFKSNVGQLALVGVFNMAVSMVFSIVLIVLIAIAVGATIGFGAFTGQSESASSAMGVVAIVVFALIGLFAIACGVVINMAFWFAPMLVAMNNMQAMDAIKLSWRAGRNNFGGYLLFLLMAFFIVLVAYIPCGLGLIVAMPVMICASYSAYREIFYGD